MYCKRPFKNPDAVLKYLGRYTHRVAISNHRILSMDNGMVSFSYRDYKDGSKKKTMQLAVNEFIRRFLLHVLPSGFRKIRHYGFLAPAAKRKKLKLCRKLLGVKFTPSVSLSTRALLQKLTGRDIAICPICGRGTQLLATGLSPPHNAIE